MKVTAMLAWWDEPPAELYECVRSMRTICDGVVAVDGAYEMTEGATRLSPPDQEQAIRQAAFDSGLTRCDIMRPPKIWTGQVEKRNAMLELAAEGSDWVVAVDADHRLVGERDVIRAELLSQDTADSIRHDFHTPPPAHASDLRRLSPHPWHTKLSGKTIEHSLIMRVLEDMRLETVHWGYSGIRNGRRVALGNWRSNDIPPGSYHRLEAPFRVDHVCFARDEMRLDRNRAYCKTRDAFRASNGFEP